MRPGYKCNRSSPYRSEGPPPGASIYSTPSPPPSLVSYVLRRFSDRPVYSDLLNPPALIPIFAYTARHGIYFQSLTPSAAGVRIVGLPEGTKARTMTMGSDDRAYVTRAFAWQTIFKYSNARISLIKVACCSGLREHKQRELMEPPPSTTRGIKGYRQLTARNPL